GSKVKYWQHRQNTDGMQVESVSRRSFTADWGNHVHPAPHRSLPDFYSGKVDANRGVNGRKLKRFQKNGGILGKVKR
ncbi:hypothetical protein HAX54_007944, partial [Datura stramonium]|nr:hypothetical protein [Datura stramonium]